MTIVGLAWGPRALVVTNAAQGRKSIESRSILRERSLDDVLEPCQTKVYILVRLSWGIGLAQFGNLTGNALWRYSGQETFGRGTEKYDIHGSMVSGDHTARKD